MNCRALTQPSQHTQFTNTWVNKLVSDIFVGKLPICYTLLKWNYIDFDEWATQAKQKHMPLKRKMILNWSEQKYKANSNEYDEAKWERGEKNRNSKLITGYILIEKPLHHSSTVAKHFVRKRKWNSSTTWQMQQSQSFCILNKIGVTCNLNEMKCAKHRTLILVFDWTLSKRENDAHSSHHKANETL